MTAVVSPTKKIFPKLVKKDIDVESKIKIAKIAKKETKSLQPIKKIVKASETKSKRKPRTTKKTQSIITEIQPNCQKICVDKLLLLFPDNIDLVENIEKAIYNWISIKALEKRIEPSWSCIDFQDIYLSKSRSIYINLNSKSYIHHNLHEIQQNAEVQSSKTPNLFESIKNGIISPEELVELTPQDLFPEKWKILIEKKIHDAQVNSQNLAIGSTDLFKCGKCKKKKCIYYQSQDRSCDEPMTTHITCTFCGNKWKE